jgi:mono/diheme cytochrome c family protein
MTRSRGIISNSNRIRAITAMVALVIVYWFGASIASAQNNTASIEQRAIALLQEKCANCHGPDKREGDFAVLTRGDLVRGGTLGPVLDATNLEQSLVLQVVKGELEGLEMPPKNPLTASEVKLLQEWLSKGALWSVPTMKPENSATSISGSNLGNAWDDSSNPARLRWFGERLNLWSLHPNTKPTPPASSANPDPNIASPRNPIDQFVDQRRKDRNVVASPLIDRVTLIRRLYMDLTGLPPQYHDMAQLPDLDEGSAYERLVDQLLASPAYGEHFGRMWLDIVRYSDSNGFDWDEFRPQAWRFRNYVIDAFNRDMPYDQFIVEQLAGDELVDSKPQSPEDLQRLIATGFLRLGPFDNAAPLFNEQDRSRAEFLADVTETAASAFLGQTLACCRCHDHKTDPWLQSDYYRFRAFFAAIEFGDQVPLETEATINEIEQHNAQVNVEIEPFEKRLAEIEKEKERSKPHEITAELKAEIAMLQQRLSESKEKLRQYQTGLIVREEKKEIPTTFVFYQGDHRSPREQVEPGIPTMFQPGNYPIENRTATAGLRLALARWIASEQNPWTARVIVNRLWQFHFGEGIVRTPNDLGWSGERPESLELLDWLAAELIRSDWSIKHIQRLIVTSRTYQEKTILGGWPRSLKRLSAEQLRDSMFAVSGLLQRRQATSPIWPPVPTEVLKANPATLDDNETKTKGWYPSPDNEQTVRSIYLVQKRTIRVPFMETFDLPDNSASCGCRTVSIVAPQALSLLNGDWGMQAAKALATDIERQAFPSTEAKIVAAYQTIFQRIPSDNELQMCVQFLTERTFSELTRALLNTNEFAFIE